MIIDLITIFPRVCSQVLGEAMIKRAQSKGLVKINIHNLRDFADIPHRKVDAPSYGGGGMVFRTEPLFRAVETILGYPVYPKKRKDKNKKVILFSPQGKTLNQRRVKEFLNYEHLVLLAPRYEGVDERVRKHLAEEEISLGDYILSGGELASMVFIDCLCRLIPGVVSDKESIKKESFEGSGLDFPHYTRPADFRGLRVPKILVSGDHQEIKKWRERKAWEVTKRKRPDLLNS
ncbi:MAG: tRNA (guanosine(37)-N1)-methyltransferase TrmD [Candidatus Omnitrophota bacterium]